MITQPVQKTVRLVVVLPVVTFLVACGSQPVAESRQKAVHTPTKAKHIRQAPQSHGARAAAIAVQQVGVPYRYGGSSRTGFDCSGLVQFSYAQAGKNLPRTTTQLWSASHTVQQQDLELGDLLFFNVDGKMSHVGMYIGRREFVHAPSSGRSVSIESLDSPYYSRALTRVARPR